MMAMRSLLTLVRVLGALALGFLLYAWTHPDTLDKWTAWRRTASADQRQDNQAGKSDGPPRSAGAAGTDKPVVMPAAAGVPATQKVTGSQAAVAHWIGARYGVAPDAIAPLVAEADILTRTYRLSPNLLIAVMAIESNFHPYIQSEAGAQGLMQVMPKIHSKRYEKFGGKTAFLDPLVSLRVGAEILRDCVKLKDGSEAEALRFYFGGGPASDTYIQKVRAEQQRLNLVARGARVPTTD
jgi:soluble lytic murein transglycosylase-like protein